MPEKPYTLQLYLDNKYMVKDKSDDEKSDDGFLRAEYDYLTRLFLDNEQLGERRVTFFMTIASAVITALGLVIGAGPLSSALTNSTSAMHDNIAFTSHNNPIL
jgi:hypothetical protein